MAVARPIEIRMLDRVRIGDGCWEWTGPKRKDGYATIRAGGEWKLIHRLSYETFIGPIPDGLVIDHLCRVRHCVRPDHLEAVTTRENLIRGNTAIARNVLATHCPQGHPYDEANTFFNKGKRNCRACRRIYQRRYMRSWRSARKQEVT